MLIITGTLAYDYIMDFPGKFADYILPDQIHNINIAFPVSKFDKRRGGTAGNTSYSLALLRTKHILFSVAGKDFEEYKNKLQTLGVDTGYISIDSNQFTSTGFAMTDKANNQIWGYFYGASEKIIDLDITTVAKKNDLVLVGPSGEKPTVNFINKLVAAGIPFVFDAGFSVNYLSANDLTTAVTHAEIIVGNDYEILMLKKKVSSFSSFTNNKIVITTKGEKGCLIVENNNQIVIPSVTPKNITDPTGAGDAWRAGFLAGYMKKLPLEVCGRVGNIVASFSIEEYGAQEHTFIINDLKDRYTQTYGSLLEW